MQVQLQKRYTLLIENVLYSLYGNTSIIITPISNVLQCWMGRNATAVGNVVYSTMHDASFFILKYEKLNSKFIQRYLHFLHHSV